MVLYLGVFTIIILLFYIGNVCNSKKPIFIALGLLIVFSGLRYNVGKDFTNYWTIFSNPDWSSLEVGYKCSCAKIIELGLGPQIIFLLSSVISIIFIHKSLCYYCSSSIITFSYLCFIFGGFYLESFNLVRQYVAIPIFFYATRYIISKEFLKYLGFILLGCLFHISILAMLPFYFILNRDYTKTQIISIFISVIIFKLFIPKKSVLSFVPIYADRYIEGHSEYVVDAGLGIGFISKLLLFFIVIAFFKDRFDRISSKTNIAINAFMFYCILMILFQDMAVFLRIAYYFHIFVIILLPNIQFCFRKSSRNIVNMVIVLYIFLLFIVQIIDIDGQLVPYNINTNLYLK